MEPTFAALILNYNDSAQVGEALKNVFSQSVPFDEILIMDDGSTDDSVAVIESMIRDIRHAKLHINPGNIGIVASVNLGFTLVESDYIHPVSANDRYFPHIVEHSRKMALRYPEVAMITANSGLWDALSHKERGALIVRLPQVEQFVTPGQYAAHNRIAPVALYGGTTTIRRKEYLALQGQDPKLAWYADWFLYYLIGLTYGFAFVPVIYVTYHLEGKKSFSHGRFNWERQKPIFLHLFTMLPERYPEQARIFRETALFPKYDLRVLALALQPQNRWFVTPLFVWRCIAHQLGHWLKAILPRPLLMSLRKLFRV